MQKSLGQIFVGFLLQAKEISAVTIKNIRPIYNVSLQINKLSIIINLSLVFSMIEAVMKKNVVRCFCLWWGGYLKTLSPHQGLAESEISCVDELWEKKSRSQF